MPNLDLDSIAINIYNASYRDLAIERKDSDEKDERAKRDKYSIQGLQKFIEQFHIEFQKMYIQTLKTLHISETRNPTIAEKVKDSLLNVLSQESEESIINPETHQLDFSTFSNKSLTKTRHIIKKMYSPQELEKAQKESEISTTLSSNILTSNQENTEKNKSSFDKLLEDYYSLSTSKERISFIEENLIYDSSNLSKDTRNILTNQLAEYMDYRQFVNGIREMNPDISRVELRNMYLEKHPELDKEKFYDTVDFTKYYLVLKQTKEEYDELLKSNSENNDPLVEQEKALLLQDIAIYSDTVTNFMEKYHLSDEIANKLCENLNEGNYSNFNEDQEFFVNAYATLIQLEEDYEINPSLELKRKIEQYEKFTTNYREENGLSEEEVIELIESYQDEEPIIEETESKPENSMPVSQIMGATVAKEIRQNLEQENDEQLNTSIKIAENPILKFFKNIQNKFTQKSLPSGHSDLNLENTANPKPSIFSKIKNIFSKLSGINQPEEPAVDENNIVLSQNKPNAWDLSEKERQFLQEGAKQIAQELQNNQNESKSSRVIEDNNSLQI